MSKRSIKQPTTLDAYKIIQSFDPKKKNEAEIKQFFLDFFHEYSDIKWHYKMVAYIDGGSGTVDASLSDIFNEYKIPVGTSGLKHEYPLEDLQDATQKLIDKFQIPTWRLLCSSYTLKGISTIGLTCAAYTLGASALGLAAAGLAGFMFNKFMFAHLKAYQAPNYKNFSSKSFSGISNGLTNVYRFMKSALYTTTSQALRDNAFFIPHPQKEIKTLAEYKSVQTFNSKNKNEEEIKAFFQSDIGKKLGIEWTKSRLIHERYCFSEDEDATLSEMFNYYHIHVGNSGFKAEYPLEDLQNATQKLTDEFQIPTWRLLCSSYTLKAIFTVGLAYTAFTLGASVIGLTVAGLAGFMFNKLMFAQLEAYQAPHYESFSLKSLSGISNGLTNVYRFIESVFYTTTQQAMEDSAFMIDPTKSGINRFTTLKPNQASSVTNQRALGFGLLAGISSALTLTYAAVPLALTRVAIAALPAATLSIIACKGPSLLQPKDGSSETPAPKHAP
jgi:hypothetical protein